MSSDAQSLYFDDLETRSEQERQEDLFSRFPGFLAEALNNTPGLANHLADVEPTQVDNLRALQQLPVLRKEDLMQAQAIDPPFGGFANIEALNGTRIFCSPGPIWEPQAPGLDPWQSARALFAAGIRPAQRVHNAFSYHMTPGAHIIDEGARALGCLVFPAGVGNTSAQVEAAAVYQPDAFVGTPDYLKVLLDAANEQGLDLSSIKRALVSGGALFPAMREEYQERGVRVLQAYATADLGVIAYESTHADELQPGMIVNENLIVEIVRPGTNIAVEEGEVGELVVTTFNSAYPLVRFGTGDLSAILPGNSGCGRTAMRIKGWMGRADQRTKVKGMFIDPRQVAKLEQQYPDIARSRLVVGRSDGVDTLTLFLEGEQLDTAAIAKSFKSITGLSGEVATAREPLANDGLVIADERDYEHD